MPPELARLQGNINKGKFNCLFNLQNNHIALLIVVDVTHPALVRINDLHSLVNLMEFSHNSETL